MEIKRMEEQEKLLNNLNSETTIREMQKYIKEVIQIRGSSNKSIKDEMLLLLEETGELAKAIRKKVPNSTIDKDKIDNYSEVEEEIADVFIVLTEICNILDIDLYDSIIKKERINIKRKWSRN